MRILITLALLSIPAAVFAAAALLDLSAAATEPFPFAAESIAQGDPVAPAVEWRDSPHGLLAVTVNLQGGSPMGYGNRGWYNSAFTKTGHSAPMNLANFRGS